MQIQVFNQQKDLKISKRAVKIFVATALSYLDVTCDEVHINFVTEKKICQIHKDFFNDPSPTDCITLPIDDQKTPGYCLLGEVFICPKAALAYDNPYEETKLYIVHTLLHLIGYQDDTPRARAAMRTREKEILNHINKKNLQLSESLV